MCQQKKKLNRNNNKICKTQWEKYFIVLKINFTFKSVLWDGWMATDACCPLKLTGVYVFFFFILFRSLVEIKGLVGNNIEKVYNMVGLSIYWLAGWLVVKIIKITAALMYVQACNNVNIVSSNTGIYYIHISVIDRNTYKLAANNCRVP